MTNDLHFQGGPESATFEIELAVRNPDGQPTGKTKTFRTDSSHKLWEFWMRNKGRPKRKKKKEVVPSAKEADQIMSTMEDYVPKKLRQQTEG